VPPSGSSPSSNTKSTSGRSIASAAAAAGDAERLSADLPGGRAQPLVPYGEPVAHAGGDPLIDPDHSQMPSKSCQLQRGVS